MKYVIIIFSILIVNEINSQIVYYSDSGFVVNKTKATNYRVYNFDNTKKKGFFKEYNFQNKLLIESGFIKFDFFDKKNQILDGQYIEYRNDTIYKINYKNNIPINQVNIYDNKNRIIQIIPVKNGKISPDSDVISFYYFPESKKNEYYVVQGTDDWDNFFGKVTFFYDRYTQTYFFNGENIRKVTSSVDIDKCYAFNYFNFKDVNKPDILEFSDNFNCGKNHNWVLFDALDVMDINSDYADIKNGQLLLKIVENKVATVFRLINPTPYKIENNDFDIKVDILSQEKCISGITINNINYIDNEYTNQYRIGLVKETESIVIEKMVNSIFVLEKIIPVAVLIKEKNELRLLKENNALKVILNNYLVYTDSDYTYVGESVGLYSYGNKGQYSSFEDFNFKLNVINKNVNAIKFKKDGDLNKIPISINDIINTDFIIDTGASNVSITPDLALLLIKSGTIKSEDWLNDKYYQFADGSSAKSKAFKIKKLKIGNKVLYDVDCSISNNLSAPLLLGQNVLNRFGKVTIDNENHILFLN